MDEIDYTREAGIAGVCLAITFIISSLLLKLHKIDRPAITYVNLFFLVVCTAGTVYLSLLFNVNWNWTWLTAFIMGMIGEILLSQQLLWLMTAWIYS